MLNKMLAQSQNPIRIIDNSKKVILYIIKTIIR
jgi:hypothetical protein